MRTLCDAYYEEDESHYRPVDPKCTDAANVSPSPAVSCAPVTETVHHCPTPSLSSGVSSPVLVQQSSPIPLSSAVTVNSPTNTALAPISSAAVQCQSKTL